MGGRLSGEKAFCMLIIHLIFHPLPLNHSQSKFPQLIILTHQQTKFLTIQFPLKQIIQPSYVYCSITQTYTSSIYKILLSTFLSLFFTDSCHLLLSGESLLNLLYQNYDPSSHFKVSHDLKHKSWTASLQQKFTTTWASCSHSILYFSLPQSIFGVLASCLFPD